MVFTLDGIEYDYMTPISEVAEASGRNISNVKQRRKEALRLKYDWHEINWDTVSVDQLTSDLGLPFEDVSDMKKMIAREKEWAIEDYTKSDEQLANEHGVTKKRVKYYRRFYDKMYRMRKKVKKQSDAISLRMRKDMSDVLNFQARQLGYKLPDYARLIFLKHIRAYPFFPPEKKEDTNSTDPWMRDYTEVDAFENQLRHLKGRDGWFDTSVNGG